MIIFSLLTRSASSQDLGQEELSEAGTELRWSTRSAGLTAQLQALRKALYHKYLQEVAALKEEHSRELKKLREERQSDRERGEKEQDLNGVDGGGRSSGSLGGGGRVVLEEKQDWERVEEEVAKVGVWCVYAAQKIILLRIMV